MNLAALLAPYTVTSIPAATQPWTRYHETRRPDRVQHILAHYTVLPLAVCRAA